MNDADMLTYMDTDAALWAEEFCKIARDHGHNLDEGWMIGWFANAIEAGRDAANRQRPSDHRCPAKCIECGVNYADPPSKLCPGCEAYREHTR